MILPPMPAAGQKWRNARGYVVTVADVLTMKVVVVDELRRERCIRKRTLIHQYRPVSPLAVGMTVRLVPHRFGLRRDREFGLIRPDWTGVVVCLEQKDGRALAVCRHEPEDCGCHLEPLARGRSLPGCPRCHGDGIATTRTLAIEEIEEVPRADD